MIPKIIFTYWEGNQLSKLHYYTIYSLTKLNPGLEIIIYTAKDATENFIQWNTGEHAIKINNTISLNDIVNINESVKLIKIDFENEYSIKNNLSVVFKADFVRIAKLYEHGGMWFDFDLLFIKEIPENLFKEYDHDILYLTYDVVIPTGLLFSSPENEMIKQIYHTALEIIKNINESDRHVNYQALGPTLWATNMQIFLSKNTCCLNNNLVYPYLDSNINLSKNTCCLNNNLVYPYLHSNINEFFNSNNDRISNTTFAVHWFNGSHCAKNYINNLDENNLDPNVSVANKYLHNIINC